MPEIPVTVRDRQYDIACTEDEHEATVTARDMLAHEMQRWISQEKIGIPHLLIMCALSFANQIRNLERQVEESKGQLDALRASEESGADASDQEFGDERSPEPDSAELEELADYAEEIAANLEKSFGIGSAEDPEYFQAADS